MMRAAAGAQALGIVLNLHGDVVRQVAHFGEGLANGDSIAGDLDGVQFTRTGVGNAGDRIGIELDGVTRAKSADAALGIQQGRSLGDSDQAALTLEWLEADGGAD